VHLDQYQKEAESTAIYPKESGITYTVLGLTNEAGEVAGLLKKLIRDHKYMIDQEYRDKIRAELGDVLWYLAMTATELGMSLELIAEYNLDKLRSRQDRGVLGGSGDDR
jgi:NTP pyrophosphatase (non-canonical NTP hydrolase)